MFLNAGIIAVFSLKSSPWDVKSEIRYAHAIAVRNVECGMKGKRQLWPLTRACSQTGFSFRTTKGWFASVSPEGVGGEQELSCVTHRESP